VTDPARFPKVGQLKTVEALSRRLEELACSLPVDDRILSAAQSSPLAEPLELPFRTAGNRWCIHPMEGWDGETDGRPSPLTLRRWTHFGQSGAKWIWGGEAAAVAPDGRANPRQLLATPRHEAGLRALHDTLVAAHREAFGETGDLVVGLQLTHSGRFCRPHAQDRLEPRIAYHHPQLDARFGIAPDDVSVVWTDAELHRLVDHYVAAARTAWRAGFDFVDVKSCHGYLLHEFLSARGRRGTFGGDFDGRVRLLRTMVRRIREAVPEIGVGVRLSVFDCLPARQTEASQSGGSAPMFGTMDLRSGEIEWDEPLRLVRQLTDWGVTMLNVSAGSPYYCPHIQRPAAFPPSDGYPPPEDPLVGAARLLDAARRCKEASPGLAVVGTGLTYFQDYAAHVAQAVVRAGWMDAVGIGRMVLSYPRFPADVLAGRPLVRRAICRTFSDCTTAPRQGWVSGCYPLDRFYKQRPESEWLKRYKQSRS